MADSNGISQATDVINSIPELTDAIFLVIQTPIGFTLTVIILLWLIVNRDFSNIFSLFERKENRRLEKIESYISSDSIADSKCLDIIKEQRNTYYFKVATRIYAEKRTRDALIELYHSSSHEISWITIKRAMPYIELTSQHSINIRKKKWHEKFGYWYNNVVAITFGMAAVFSILYIILSSGLDFPSVLKVLGLVLFLTGFAIFIFSQNFPYFSSEKIATELLNTSTNKTCDIES